MGLFFRLKSLFTSERHNQNDFEPVPIFRTETPEKIIETRIKPVKIPTIVDVTDRLSSIFHELSLLKTEMVSKSWFLEEYEDSSVEIIKHLSDMEVILSDINSKLSNFTKSIFPAQPPLLPTESPISISDKIFNIVQSQTNVRYKDITHLLPFSEPTISKYIKILCNDKKIKRTKIGKAVYYTLS